MIVTIQRSETETSRLPVLPSPNPPNWVLKRQFRADSQQRPHSDTKWLRSCFILKRDRRRAEVIVFTITSHKTSSSPCTHTHVEQDGGDNSSFNLLLITIKKFKWHLLVLTYIWFSASAAHTHPHTQHGISLKKYRLKTGAHQTCLTGFQVYT